MTKDTLPTIWSADPHTLAKHQILRHYLQAWFPILSRGASYWNREPLFIDGFAGPGEYEGGEPGSPIIALKAAIEHNQSFATPIHFVFVEKRKDRFKHLRNVLRRLEEAVSASPNAVIDSVRQGDCDNELAALIRHFDSQGRQFGPALAFLDQFGYGAVSMDLIQRIMSWPQCEVFSYLNARDLNRWIPDLTKAPSLDRAFGDDRWRQALETPRKDRRAHLVSLYQSALQELGSASFVQRFTMFDRHGDLLYWLVFCTNNIQGLLEMKRAMWSVDKTGTFRFSDHDDPDQLRLLADEFSEDWLADQLLKKYSGTTRSVAEIEQYVLTETPCYLFKGALGKLKREHHIQLSYPTTTSTGRGFPREASVRFLRNPTQSTLF